jgi:ubiquinone/menaquinone biosynthesis C-methylase UbiE
MPGILERIRRLFAAPASPTHAAEGLARRARESGDPFKQADYFAAAEPDMEAQWRTLVWPRIGGLDLTRVLDLAAGHGRNSAKLREVAGAVVIVDINDECLDACRKRFAGDPRISYVKTDGATLGGVEDASITLVYSFDSMVHFAPEVVRSYLHECSRVLVPGGHGFCHHSNYTGNREGDFRASPHWRNHMSRELFADYCREAGLDVVRSDVIDWGQPPDFYAGLDCLTVFRKP